LVSAKPFMAQRHQTLTILSIVSAFFFLSPALCHAQGIPSRTQARIEAIFLKLEESHGIDASYQNLRSYRIRNAVFDEIEEGEAGRFLAFLKVFSREIDKYPAGFFRKGGLFKVLFVKKLFFEKQPAQGVYRHPEGYMLFDIYRDFGNELNQRHGIHHEIFHMIDTTMPADPRDPWSSFNEPDFVYEKQGRWHGERNKANYFAPQRLGFVTDYALVSAVEDKAEVYACLFVPSQSRLIHKWQKKDPVLAKKISHIKGLLQQYYPKITPDFWQQLSK